MEEAGDLIQPIADGVISEDHIRGEIGEVLAGRKVGRARRDDLTFFKSVGNAVEDALAARHVLIEAQKLGLGQRVPW